MLVGKLCTFLRLFVVLRLLGIESLHKLCQFHPLAIKLRTAKALEGNMGVPGVHKVVYLVLFFFTLRTLTERDGHPIVLIYISSPVVIKSMRK